jgi:ABC-type bacteriocin/lantibiotic exporter with double-glycine peptidase domain
MCLPGTSLDHVTLGSARVSEAIERFSPVLAFGASVALLGMTNDSDMPMDSEIIFETINLRKEFGALVAVDDVSLKVRRNTLHAIIGPNGAGKTTFFNLL